LAAWEFGARLFSCSLDPRFVGRGLGVSSDPTFDRSQYGFDVGNDRVVFKPHDAIPFLLTVLLSRAIATFNILVVISIKFDDDPSFQTNEIDDKLPNRMLTPEFQSKELSSAQSAPQ
jgi:hypothetical protein